MSRMQTDDLSNQIGHALDRVARTGERITLENNGREVAMLISMEDAALLQETEDLMDLKAALEALREEGDLISLEDIKRKYGA